MNTKPPKAEAPLVYLPLISNELVVCKTTPVGSKPGIMAASLDEIKLSMYESTQVLSWIGDNFAWRDILAINEVPTSRGETMQMTVSSRTGIEKSNLLFGTPVRVDKEVYGLTTWSEDGIWRKVERLTSGRPASSVNGPNLPWGGQDPVPWVKDRFHMATIQIVKAKQRALGNRLYELVLSQGAQTVVLGSGMIVRTVCKKGEFL